MLMALTLYSSFSSLAQFGPTMYFIRSNFYTCIGRVLRQTDPLELNNFNVQELLNIKKKEYAHPNEYMMLLQFH
jgi:hypothetical protein